jgi:hypothetical protein
MQPHAELALTYRFCLYRRRLVRHFGSVHHQTFVEKCHKNFPKRNSSFFSFGAQEKNKKNQKNT